jgi:anti-anti-sigma factor
MRLPSIEVYEEKDAIVATVMDGADIDIGNAVELGEMLFEAVPNQARGLVLDLGNVRYVDSAGVRMLFSLARQLETSRQVLALSVPEGNHLLRLIEITQLGDVTAVCSDLSACVEAVSARD